jgi:hypothetical protein
MSKSNPLTAPTPFMNRLINFDDANPVAGDAYVTVKTYSKDEITRLLTVLGKFGATDQSLFFNDLGVVGVGKTAKSALVAGLFLNPLDPTKTIDINAATNNYIKILGNQ